MTDWTGFFPVGSDKGVVVFEIARGIVADYHAITSFHSGYEVLFVAAFLKIGDEFVRLRFERNVGLWM